MFANDEGEVAALDEFEMRMETAFQVAWRQPFARPSVFFRPLKRRGNYELAFRSYNARQWSKEHHRRGKTTDKINSSHDVERLLCDRFKSLSVADLETDSGGIHSFG